MARNFRNRLSVGVAMNSGAHEQKLKLIQLLDRAAEIADELGMYVEGTRFAAKLEGLVGTLQRSADASTPTTEDEISGAHRTN